MSYEERAVFPYVRNLLEGKRDPKYNITIFRKRHDQIEMKITELKNILIKYYPGAGTNMLNSVLFDIFATEEDLASHPRVEDYLLYRPYWLWKNNYKHESMSTNLKIAIAEPSVIIRSGLENLLKRLPGFRIQMVEIHSVESLFDSLLCTNRMC